MNHRAAWGVVCAALVGAGCGGGDEARVRSDSAALSELSEWVVTLEPDLESCPRPFCGGYFVQDANTQTRRTYVSLLELAHSGLDETERTRALAEPLSELLVRGHLTPVLPDGTRAFVVEAAFRGLPGVTRPAAASVYTIRSLNLTCEKEPCLDAEATYLNGEGPTGGPIRPFSTLDLSPAVPPLVDGAWLAQRLSQGRAIAAGALRRGEELEGGPDILFRAHALYVQLPERPGPCPIQAEPTCAEGTVATYQRDANRCLGFAGCRPVAAEGACSQSVPTCAPGYQLQTWLDAQSCAAYACDPIWSHPPPPPAETP